MSSWQIIERFYQEKLLLSYNALCLGWLQWRSQVWVSDDLKYYLGACTEWAEWARNEQEYFLGLFLTSRKFPSWYFIFCLSKHAVINVIKRYAVSWNSESNYEAASCMTMALSRMSNLYLLVWSRSARGDLGVIRILGCRILLLLSDSIHLLLKKS